MNTSVTPSVIIDNLDQLQRQAIGLARGLDPNLSTNNRGKIARRAKLDGIVEAMAIVLDRDTYEKFMDAVVKAETEGK